MKKFKVLAVIPARGGSKGIPRKSIRPVAGKPMIYYAIQACQQSIGIDDVVVSTDDEEIALLSERFGARAIGRSAILATDLITLDPVIVDATESAENSFNQDYNVVVTVQPTSPLVVFKDIDRALELLSADSSDTVISVVDDRHLCWKVVDNEVVPAYKERVNRQMLPKNYRETGAIVACTRDQLKKGVRFGEKVSLLAMPQGRSFDIDSFEDLYLCESVLKRKSILFIVVGYAEVGLGHAYRALMLAHELVNYDIYFICDEKSTLAAEHIGNSNYNVVVENNANLMQLIENISPNIIVNDVLDTTEEYMGRLKNLSDIVVNFEDLGDGSYAADLVINALYPSSSNKNVLAGAKYFCLRDEFLYIPSRIEKDRVERILLVFGGVDEGNLTVRILTVLLPVCIDQKISIDIVVGPGYKYHKNIIPIIEENQNRLNLKLVSDTSRISEIMHKSDLAITSGGRTVLELCSMYVPSIVICQNERETTHYFASKENGVENLGLYSELSDEKFIKTFTRLIDSVKERSGMIERMKSMDLTKGKKKVIDAITSLVE